MLTHFSLFSGIGGIDLAAEWAGFTTEFLWNSLNEKRGYGWDTNPWVWVVEFEHMSKGEALLKESEVEK